MKIVIDATAAVSGGKVYLEHLLPQLARSGDRYIVFHTGDLEGLDAAGVELRKVSPAVDGQRNWALEALVKLFWRLVVFPFHLRRINPDVIFSNAGFLPALLPAGSRTVVAIHNSMPLRDELISEERSLLRRWRLRMLSRLMRRSLERCDAAIVFSEDSLSRVVAEVGSKRRDPSVVYHGIDWGEAEYRRAVSEDHLRDLGINLPYLLFVSQFHRYKNITTLLEALAILREKHAELSLVLVGEAADKGYWREVQDAISRLELTDAVVHIPQCPREELIGIYNGARVFVHPSLAETCSFPLLEALALGLPIAAARAAALPEMAADGAVYFDPLDPQGMAQAIDRLLVDESLRDELRSRAISRAAFFSWRECGRRTLEVIHEVAGRQL
ncbi:MAG: glycosyltransferase family 4 protein [Acidobacteriota bacterium]|nr:MAG: glycosyltransferase family 4 protein [Acidobacteriota bacterium]